MKYGDLTLGQVEALVNKLGGMSSVRDILSGRKIVSPSLTWDTCYQNTISLPDGTERDVVVVSGEQLGLQHDATREEVLTRARVHGLVQCPKSMIAVLCAPLQSTESVTVITDTPVDSDRRYDVVSLNLCTSPMSPTIDLVRDSARTWPSDHKWLFVLPRP